MIHVDTCNYQGWNCADFQPFRLPATFVKLNILKADMWMQSAPWIVQQTCSNLFWSTCLHSWEINHPHRQQPTLCLAQPRRSRRVSSPKVNSWHDSGVILFWKEWPVLTFLIVLESTPILGNLSNAMQKFAKKVLDLGVCTWAKDYHESKWVDWPAVCKMMQWWWIAWGCQPAKTDKNRVLLIFQMKPERCVFCTNTSRKRGNN